MSGRNGGWTISDHAWDRIAPMGLTRLDVLAVLQDSEQSYTTDPGPGEQERRVYQRGALAVVVETLPVKRVITVLWRCQEKWERQKVNAR